MTTTTVLYEIQYLSTHGDWFNSGHERKDSLISALLILENYEHHPAPIRIVRREIIESISYEQGTTSQDDGL